MVRISNSEPQQVISFYRESNGDQVIALFNFAENDCSVHCDTKYIQGIYLDSFTGKTVKVPEHFNYDLPKWSYLVLEKTES